jgi:hypothetical protein
VSGRATLAARIEKGYARDWQSFFRSSEDRMIRVACTCGRQLQVDAKQAGSSVACPVCARRVTVSDGSILAGPADPWYAADSVGPSDAASKDANRVDDNETSAFESANISRKALWSLGLGLGSFCGFVFTAIPAIILGIVALAEIRRSGGRTGGTRLAITGIASGAIGSCLSVPLIIGLAVPTVQRFRDVDARMRSRHNLQRLALAMQRYHDINGTFPAAGGGLNIHPGLSWRVTLLPFLQEESLFRQFRLDEPADSPANQPLLERMPRVYAMPETEDPPGTTRYRVFTGDMAAFAPPSRGGRSSRGRSVADFTDGVTSTLLIIEATKAVPWTRPDELAYAPDRPVPPLNTTSRGTNAIFADGSLHVLPPDLREADLRALITRNGGESVTPP